MQRGFAKLLLILFDKIHMERLKICSLELPETHTIYTDAVPMKTF